MPDYKKMYTTLFQSMTRAIIIMQEAQQETEEIYLSEEYLDIRIFETSKKKEDGTE